MPETRIPPRVRRAPLALYANYCEIGHNAFEFLIDFGQFRPEESTIQLHSRIVSGPVQAKIFARMLMRAIERYEAEHGTIADLDDDDALELLLASVPDFERRAISARNERRPPAARADRSEANASSTPDKSDKRR
jgi:hypothetical protein